ncbi:DHA2 family efflux MFS transporter permease subunit [Streptomyces sp. NPDC056948]|uniref:DHA2 family efflux MFS transporter permease subunit n=1 Tax=Streptomyces sp. NPDC056948 TaxID=3345975 RepID=UPI003631B74C
MPRQVKVVIGLLLVATFVMILNETLMSVALPRLMAVFDVGAGTAQWLTTGFLLTMAVVIPTTGLILRRFNTRAVFLAATSLFTAGTALAAAAPHFAVLVAGRMIQAGGTAVMLPLLTTTVITFVPADRRGRTMGLISIVIAVAPAVGPAASGLILSALSWHWLFLAVLPIALLSLAAGAALVRNITTPERVRCDLLSVVLSTLAFGGLIFGLSSIGESAGGHAPLPLFVPLSVGGAALVLFVWRQLCLQREDAALLDLRPLRIKPFVVGLTALLLSMGALFGTLVLLPLYLQNVRGLSTLRTGLLLLPGGLAMGMIAPVVGRLYDRFGPRLLVIPGTSVVALALGAMSTLDAGTPVSRIILIHVLQCLGLGCVLTPVMTSALGSLSPGLYAHGSAVLNTLQQLAGAAGTSLFVTVMNTVGAEHGRSGAGSAAQVAGIQEAFLWGVGMAVLALVASLFIRRTAVPATGQGHAPH